MIYLFMALYGEAKPVISRFQLKRENTRLPFEVFGNQEQGIRLVLTGTGSVAAAAAVSCVCTAWHVEEGDFLVNLGSCAGAAPLRQIFLCSKITDGVTGRDFYPDMLYAHSFSEGELITEAGLYTGEEGLYTGEEEEYADEKLHDMEGAGIYQAGSYFFAPHQMSFLKVVTDFGEPEKVTADQLTSLIQDQMDGIATYILQLKNIGEREQEREENQFSWDKEWMEQLCLDLHCSETMNHQLHNLIRYLTLAGVDYRSYIDRLYAEERLPCNNRREGKQCLEDIRTQFL